MTESQLEDTQMAGDEEELSPPEKTTMMADGSTVVEQEEKLAGEKAAATTTEEEEAEEEDATERKEGGKEEKQQQQQQHPSLAAVLVEKSSSFREESNFLSDLKKHEKKALFELRAKVEEAIVEKKLFKSGDGEDGGGGCSCLEDVTLWGVPLLPSKYAEGTNVVLLKFLRAREFKVDDAFLMLQNTMQWRRDRRIDTILQEESLGEGLEAAAYMGGVDRDGHPICYNVYGVFQDEELYQRAFGSPEKVDKFVRWRLQVMEREVQRMDFKPGAAASILQVIDLKDAPGLAKKELRSAMRSFVQELQDNYPEFVAKSILINVPFWYYAVNAILSPFLTRRTRSKFVFARPANVPDTLLRYIPPELIPTTYGGLRHPNDAEFAENNGDDAAARVSELTVKAGATETVDIPAPEVGATLLWDLTVLGWEVNYKEEFVPDGEGSYTVVVRKGRRMAAEDPPVRNEFRCGEAGRVVLTIENATSRKKKALFRYKTKGV